MWLIIENLRLKFILNKNIYFIKINKSGLATIHLDKEYLGKRRIIIGHFSVLKEELMGECFGLLMTHIYEKDKCSEIRISL